MEDNFWTMFRETGEPLCYLLFKAEAKEAKERDES